MIKQIAFASKRLCSLPLGALRTCNALMATVSDDEMEASILDPASLNMHLEQDVWL